jgi:DNA-binding NtrC family response regulator
MCEVLLQHSWPGNVRELENVISSACIAVHARKRRAEGMIQETVPTPVSSTG